jgi:hypothetical protein
MEYEKYSQQNAGEAEKIIPSERLAEICIRENAEDSQGDRLLNHF